MAWLWVAAWMIVHGNDGCGAQIECSLDNLSWKDTGGIDRAAKQFLNSKHSVLCVEKHDTEDLLLKVSKLVSQKFQYVLGAFDKVSLPGLLMQPASTNFSDGSQRRNFGSSHSFHLS